MHAAHHGILTSDNVVWFEYELPLMVMMSGSTVAALAE